MQIGGVGGELWDGGERDGRRTGIAPSPASVRIQPENPELTGEVN